MSCFSLVLWPLDKKTRLIIGFYKTKATSVLLFCPQEFTDKIQRHLSQLKDFMSFMHVWIMISCYITRLLCRSFPQFIIISTDSNSLTPDLISGQLYWLEGYHAFFFYFDFFSPGHTLDSTWWCMLVENILYIYICICMYTIWWTNIQGSRVTPEWLNGWPINWITAGVWVPAPCTSMQQPSPPISSPTWFDHFWGFFLCQHALGCIQLLAIFVFAIISCANPFPEYNVFSFATSVLKLGNLWRLVIAVRTKCKVHSLFRIFLNCVQDFTKPL